VLRGQVLEGDDDFGIGLEIELLQTYEGFFETLSSLESGPPLAA
jgi:hypothetical protein